MMLTSIAMINYGFKGLFLCKHNLFLHIHSTIPTALLIFCLLLIYVMCSGAKLSDSNITDIAIISVNRRQTLITCSILFTVRIESDSRLYFF